MRMTRWWFANVLVVGFAAATAPAALAGADQVHIAPAPQGEELSRDFTVQVEGKDVPVYVTKVGPADPARRWKAMDDKVHSADYFDTASFATFDMNGRVTITVMSPETIRSAKVLPTSFGITPQIDGKQLTFDLSEPRPLTVEVNGNWVGSLHLFAHPFETDVPRADDPNVVFFGPGIHEVRDGLMIRDGQTLYLAGGAILKGTGRGGPVVTLQGKNVTLRGRGALDGGNCPTHSRNLLFVRGSDIHIEGIILRDSSTWNMPIRQSDRVRVHDIAVLGYRANSDGIDICNSRDVTVENCFLRTLDDLIVVKSDRGQGEVHHVVAKRCVLWNQVAHALSVGAELRENVDDVLFTDCDVIHDTGREWSLRVYHCDAALISNIRFENIRIEEAPRLISLWIGKAVWSRDTEPGRIKDVLFKNINATATVPVKIELKGFDADHGIENVRFEDVHVNGKPLTAADVKKNEFVKQIDITP